MKSKGFALTRVLAVLLLVVAIAGLCYATYVPTDINSEICANHDTLSVFLRDVLGNMASDAYLFNPRALPPPAVEGRVYYDSDDFALLLYNGTSWQTIDAAGGMTLNSAYDFGGAGTGRTITATDGSVLIHNTEPDGEALLELHYFTGAQTGEGLLVTMADGSGNAIDVENTGTGYDFEGSGGLFTADLNGNIVCVDLTTSDDVLFQGTTYDVAFDASGEMLHFEDDAVLGFGGAHDGGADMTFTFESVGSTLDIAGDDLTIEVGVDGSGLDIRINSEAAGEYALFEEEAAELLLTNYDIQFDDDADLIIGSGNDWVIEDDTGDTLEILTKLADGTATINLGVDGAGSDLKMFPETAGDYVLFDSDADEMYFEDCDLKLNEGAQFEFCYDDNATDWTMDLATADTLLFTCTEVDESPQFLIGVDQAGADVKVYGTTAGAYCVWDAGSDGLWLEKADIALGDGDAILFGDALGTGAFTLSSTGAVLTLAQVAADTGTIVIGADNTDVPITWHGETAGADIILTGDTILFDDIDMTFEDTDILNFGDAGADGSITSDGTNIDVTITAAMTLGDGGTTNYAQIAADGEITLAGTAMVTKNHQLPLVIGAGSASISLLTGAPSIDFNATDEIAYVTFQVPNDWDEASDLTLVMMVKNEIAEDDGDDVSFTCQVKGIGDGEAHTDVGQTVAILQDLTGGDQGQNYVNRCPGTIVYNDGAHPIAAGDTVIIKATVNLGAGVECTGPLHIIDWWIEYTANKLGTAT